MPEIRMNSLKSLAMNCGPLSEMIRGRASGCFSLAACRMISMSVIRLPQIPVDDVSATAIEHAAQVIECPADVDVRHVDVPVLMGRQRLLKPRALLRRLAVPLRQQSRLAENPPDA